MSRKVRRPNISSLRRTSTATLIQPTNGADHSCGTILSQSGRNGPTERTKTNGASRKTATRKPDCLVPATQRRTASSPFRTAASDTGIGLPGEQHVEDAGARFWWGGHDPVSSLRNNLARDLEKMRARLLELMENAPPEALEKARTDGGREKARAEWAKKQYIADTGRRRFTRVQIVSLRILKGQLGRGKKPRQANPGGGNDRLVYFVDGNGKRNIEVVSTLDANTSSFRERWRREGGRLLFVLRKNDLVEMAADPRNSDSPRLVYRTVSFSGAGNPDLEFLPVEEARAPTVVPIHVRTRIRSVTAFNDRRPEMILLDPTGRERWRSPRLN